MLTTIKDPRIANGFSILSRVLGAPNAQAAIEADLNARRRDLLMAQTASERTDDLVKRNQLANTGIFQADIARMPDLSQTPAGIAQIFSSVPGMGADYMRAAPGFVSGVRASGADPNFINSDDFGKILLGTGVVNDYGQTPQGQAIDNQNAMDLKALENQGRMDLQNDDQLFKIENPNAALGGAAKPTSYDPKEIGAIWEQVAGQLESMGVTADGTTRNAIMPGVVERMRTNGGNIDAAIADVMSQFDTQAVDENGWWPGGGRTRLVPKQVPAGLPADKPAAPGAAPSPAAAGTIQEGQTATNPQTGEKIVYKGGQWVSLDTPAADAAPATKTVKSDPPMPPRSPTPKPKPKVEYRNAPFRSAVRDAGEWFGQMLGN